jgi:dynein heavy chain
MLLAPAPAKPSPGRYEKAQKPLSSYETDINEFANKQDEVAHEETTANVKFLFIDCGPLKQALSSHCDLWRSKLTGLLNKQAAAELRALHETFKAGLEALAPMPDDLQALAEAVALHSRLADDRGRLRGRFEPLRCARAQKQDRNLHCLGIGGTSSAAFCLVHAHTTAHPV